MKKRFIFIAVLALLFAFPTTGAQAEIPQDDLMSLVGNRFIVDVRNRNPMLPGPIPYAKITLYEQATEVIYNGQRTPTHRNMIDIHEIIAGYDESFFDENFLLVTPTGFPHSGVRDFHMQVTSIVDEGDYVRIGTEKSIIAGMMTSPLDVDVIIELDRSLLSRNLVFEMRVYWHCFNECLLRGVDCIFGPAGAGCWWAGPFELIVSASKFHPPLTGVPGITATMVAMLGLVGVSAVLWGVVLRRGII